jgi:hypothetical protein
MFFGVQLSINKAIEAYRVEYKNNPNTTTDSHHNINTSSGSGAALSVRHNQKLDGQTKEGDSKQEKKYSLYAVGFLTMFSVAVAVVLWWQPSRLFLDAHNGAISAITTFAIMVLTFFYVRYAKSQWAVMEGQLQEMQQAREIANKTLILQFRPKIIVRNAKAFDFHVAEVGKPGNGKVTFMIVNVGGSTAKITEGNVFMMVAKSPKNTERGTDYPIQEFTLQPGQDKSFTITMGDTTDDFRWVEFCDARDLEQSKFVYLCGKIRYFDDNSIPRSVRFKRKYEPSNGRFIPEENSDEEYAD